MLKMVLLLVFSVSVLKLFSKPYGMMILLESITDREILEIIIIEIQALNPPKKTMAAMMVLPNFCGIRMEKNSGLTFWPANRTFPPQAIGKTKKLINKR